MFAVRKTVAVSLLLSGLLAASLGGSVGGDDQVLATETEASWTEELQPVHHFEIPFEGRFGSEDESIGDLSSFRFFNNIGGDFDRMGPNEGLIQWDEAGAIRARNTIPWSGVWNSLEGLAGERHPMEKVRISDDGRRFVLAESGKPFVPWGFNYLGEFGKLMEDSWDKDWARIERDFREMRKLGGNVVRIHLQFGTYVKGPEEFDQAQLDRLRKLLDLAQETGLYLDITGLCCYRLDQIPKWYDVLGEAQRWEVQAQWWKTIARTCANHPAVFCYDLMNEPIIGGPAKGGEPRWVGRELGGFHFVQRISEEAKGRTNLEIAEAWAKQLTLAIRQEDSKTPITVGVIPWAQIWPKAKPVFYSPGVSKHFDFVSIHVYPGQGKVEQAIAALAVYDIGKPLVVEETFPLECSLEEMNHFINGGKTRVDGWMSHYFGHTIEDHERGAEPIGTAPEAPFRATVADFLKFWRDKGKIIAGTP